MAPALHQSPVNAEAFWQFSLALYPKLKQPLLTLQDQYQSNVNLLLFLLWRQQQPCANWQSLQQAINTTHQQFTAPLRQLRRHADAHPLLRSQLLQAELAAEQLEQQALIACQVATNIQPNNGATELKAYLVAAGVPAGQLAQYLLDLDQGLAQLASAAG